jgi:hypothetical protein
MNLSPHSNATDFPLVYACDANSTDSPREIPGNGAVRVGFFERGGIAKTAARMPPDSHKLAEAGPDSICAASGQSARYLPLAKH